jgi:hypothetical protein
VAISEANDNKKEKEGGMQMSIVSRTRRMMATLLMLSLALALPAMAADIPSEVTLFKNVNIFDGKSEKLLQGQDVLVVGNLIKQVAKNIPTSGTYEIDAETGGVTRKTVSFGGAQAYTGYTAGGKAATSTAAFTSSNTSSLTLSGA